ncbi:MAG: sugar phosphate isomerase/epimerase [Anaerolineales bacterium]|nr:sugar phosphate isomerase/epimerase [Anaerolineales bacterium]
MKIACSTFMAPGKTIREKLDNLERFGFEGVEVRMLSDEATPELVAEYEEALAASSLEVGAVIVPGFSCALKFDSEESFQIKLKEAKKALDIGARFGGGVFVTPEYSPQPIPLWHPPTRIDAREREVFYRFMTEIAEYAVRIDGYALLEPINRYETHFYHNIYQVVEVIEAVGSERIRLVIDFFHMNLEEGDIPASIEYAAAYIKHVQLGDNNRQLPGYGHTNFVSGFAALKRIGYDGLMALECQIPDDPERELPACVQYLRRCISGATLA